MHDTYTSRTIWAYQKFFCLTLHNETSGLNLVTLGGVLVVRLRVAPVEHGAVQNLRHRPRIRISLNLGNNSSGLVVGEEGRRRRGGIGDFRLFTLRRREAKRVCIYAISFFLKGRQQVPIAPATALSGGTAPAGTAPGLAASGCLSSVLKSRSSR